VEARRGLDGSEEAALALSCRKGISPDDVASSASRELAALNEIPCDEAGPCGGWYLLEELSVGTASIAKSQAYVCVLLH
jgi:hypothetical protein